MFKPNYTYQQPYQEGIGLKFLFLPSDPDEIIDSFKLLYFKTLGGMIILCSRNKS